MAGELSKWDHSFKAGADLSAKQFFILKLDTTADQVVLAAASTDFLIGVLQDKPASGRAAQVRLHGISKVVAGGTISVADRLTADSAGKAVAASPAGGTNAGLIGYALEAAASGETFTALIMPQRIQG